MEFKSDQNHIRSVSEGLLHTLLNRLSYSCAMLLSFVLVTILFISTSRAQTGATPSGGGTQAADTAIVFQPSHPLLQTAQEKARLYPNSWGFNASFSDYGFGGGTLYTHTFSPEFTGGVSLDLGTAKGPREFGLDNEMKVNRIFVIPVMLNAQYRLFRNSLGENLRPYAAVGAGPVAVMTTPYQEDFFSAFKDATSKVIPGGYVGVGANFGTDPKTTFGANVRYFIIPYPGSVQSTTTQSLSNFSGLFLTVNYGFNF